MKSVFISSTSRDLTEHRAAVDKAIRRLELRPINMDDFGSQPGGASGVSLREVGKADIFVGIIANRYGYVPDGMEKSVTEQEYDEAVKRGLPRLMYILDPDHDWPTEAPHVDEDESKAARLQAFKDRINSTEVRSLFTTPDNLAAQLMGDLSKWLSNRNLMTDEIFGNDGRQKSHELARSLSIAATKLDSAIKSARSPITWSNEAVKRIQEPDEDTKLSHLLDEKYARVERLKAPVGILNEIIELNHQARFDLNHDFATYINRYGVVIQRISAAIQSYFKIHLDPRPGSYDPKIADKLRDIVYGIETDTIGQEISKITLEFTNELKKYR